MDNLRCGAGVRKEVNMRYSILIGQGPSRLEPHISRPDGQQMQVDYSIFVTTIITQPG